MTPCVIDGCGKVAMPHLGSGDLLCAHHYYTRLVADFTKGMGASKEEIACAVRLGEEGRIAEFGETLDRITDRWIYNSKRWQRIVSVFWWALVIASVAVVTTIAWKM